MARDRLKDEPWITLPTQRLMASIVICSAVAAALWAAGALAFGYGATAAASGALGAAIVMAVSMLALLLIMPWKARPASTGMLLWLAGDMLSMAISLGAGFLLYSATSIPNMPLLLGVVLAFLLVLPGKAAAVGSHMKQYGP